ncbi:MAG: hypothetical protein GX446_13335 [Chthonomonadales bacterium]|nr:hypothetical protein [Chthonomonadales bacterium]
MKAIRRTALCLPLLLAMGSALGSPMAVHGWLVHTSEPAYIDRVLAAAQTYGVNHLDLSHNFVDRIDDIIAQPGLAQRVEGVARRGRRRGIKVFVWSRELNTRKPDLVLDPGKPEGRAFWQARQKAYRDALRRCPSVAGVVIMFGSCPTEVWDPRITDPYWNRLSWAARVRYVTERIRNVVCNEMKRELWVRDFNHSPKQLEAIVEGLRDFPGITAFSKDAPQDFQLFYPHSFAIGAYGRTPQALEVDLNGEYWGQSAVPVSLVRYLRYRIGYGARKGVCGVVGRIDTYRNRALGTPSEINLYAMSRLVADPCTSEQAIYDGWLARQYGLTPGAGPARSLQAILDRTLDFAKCTYYTLGFWTPKNQSSMPASPDEIRNGIIGKSTAIWDNRARVTEQRLLNPDEPTVSAIMAQKARGVRLADQNLRALQRLEPFLRKKDYDDLYAGLALATRVARLNEAVARAYWWCELEQRGHHGRDRAALDAAVNDLIRWADRIEFGDVLLPDRGRQAAKLRSFAAALRRQRAPQRAPTPSTAAPTFRLG